MIFLRGSIRSRLESASTTLWPYASFVELTRLGLLDSKGCHERSVASVRSSSIASVSLRGVRAGSACSGANDQLHLRVFRSAEVYDSAGASKNCLT